MNPVKFIDIKNAGWTVEAYYDKQYPSATTCTILRKQIDLIKADAGAVNLRRALAMQKNKDEGGNGIPDSIFETQLYQEYMYAKKAALYLDELLLRKSKNYAFLNCGTQLKNPITEPSVPVNTLNQVSGAAPKVSEQQTLLWIFGITSAIVIVLIITKKK